MILLPRRCLLAIAAVVDVALHARPTPVAAKALAARHNLPPRHLETLLQALVRANILKGVRGPRGGYELARERRRITAADIVRAIVVDDEDHHADTTHEPELLQKVVAPIVVEAGRGFLDALGTTTVNDLCEQARRAGADPTATIKADFTI